MSKYTPIIFETRIARIDTNEDFVKECFSPIRVNSCNSCLNNLIKIILFSTLYVFGCAGAHSATDTSLQKIMGNMGNIDLNGLPKLSFEIVDRYDIGELAALGFTFKLTHRPSLRQGRIAKTEWSFPCLQTCAYIDKQGTVTWLTTTGQTVRFQKNEHGYVSSNNNAVVKVIPETNTIEITTRAMTRWCYRNGFLESISSRGSDYSVTTNRGTILSISKRILSREIPLLKCVYSKQGDLAELEFPENRKYRLQWSDDHSLMSIDGPEGRRFDFEYTNSLLTCWTKANGPRNELKWHYYLDNVRTTAFQTPPVLLRKDVSYVYDWDKGGTVNTVKVYDKNGLLLSETKIGATGMVQTTPNEIIKHTFKNNP